MEKKRIKYLKELAENYDEPFDVFYALGELLGESEDYDALVTTLEDFDGFFE